jgi:hypothetical protein
MSARETSKSAFTSNLVIRATAAFPTIETPQRTIASQAGSMGNRSAKKKLTIRDNPDRTKKSTLRVSFLFRNELI